MPSADLPSKSLHHKILSTLTMQHGSTGIASLGNGDFYISHPFQENSRSGTTVKLYHFDPDTANFTLL